MQKYRAFQTAMMGIVFALISFYQKTISPDHGLFAYSRRRCRFFPSCSEYSREALSRYGLFGGTAVSLKRIIQCGPWSAGGYDPVLLSTHNEYVANKTNTHS